MSGPGPRPLVVGVGNPGRGDDGVGWAVVERGGADPRLAGAGVRLVLQLTPELAADVAAASVVVIADAEAGAPPGRVRWWRVDVGEGPDRTPALSHHLTPAALARLAALAYGGMPPAFVVAVGVAVEALAAGAPLSPSASAAVAPAADLVVGLASAPGRQPPSPI